MSEIRAVAAFPDYGVDALGNVYSRKSGEYRRLRPSRTPFGYVSLSLYEKGKRHMRMAHRLVAEAFIGPCPPGLEVAHCNGDPADNRVENLRYDTRSGNLADRAKHGTEQRGESNPSVRLGKQDIIEIRRSYGAGELSQDRLAEKFHVTQSQIGRIVRRENWTHV